MPKNEDLNTGKKFYQRFRLMLCLKCLRFTLAHLLFAKSSKPLMAPSHNFLRLLVLCRVFDWCHKIRIWTRAKSFIKDFVLDFVVNFWFTLAHLLFAKSSKPLIAPGPNFLRLLVLWRVIDWCHKIRIWTRAKSFIKDFVFAVNVSAFHFLVFLPGGLEFQNFVASPALYCFFLHFASIYYAKKIWNFFVDFFAQNFSKSQNGET